MYVVALMCVVVIFFFFKQKTAYEMRISDWSSDVCSSDLPVQPPGAVRVGGFGGIAGLSDYLVREKIDLVLDATHPFAEQMARHAFEACRALGLPRAKLVRPPWSPSPGDRWTMMPSVAAAAVFLRFHPAQIGRAHV